MTHIELTYPWTVGSNAYPTSPFCLCYHATLTAVQIQVPMFPKKPAAYVSKCAQTHTLYCAHTPKHVLSFATQRYSPKQQYREMQNGRWRWKSEGRAGREKVDCIITGVMISTKSEYNDLEKKKSLYITVCVICRLWLQDFETQRTFYMKLNVEMDAHIQQLLTVDQEVGLDKTAVFPLAKWPGCS